MRKVLTSALVLGACLGSVKAEPIMLSSTDGFVDIEGELVEFDGNSYRVQTLSGLVTIPLAGTLCSGAGCPPGVPLAEVVAKPILPVAAAPPITTDLLAELVAGFAQSQGVSADITATSEGTAQINLGGNDLPNLLIGTTDTLGVADTEVAILASTPDGTRPDGSQLMAVTSFHPVVSGDVGIDEISLTNLARVLSGEVTNWNQIGGADLAITVLSTFAETPASRAVQNMILTPVNKNFATDNLVALESESRLTEALALFPGSIAIVSSQQAREQQLLAIESCGFWVGSPEFNAKSRRTPLTAPITISALSSSDGPSFLNEWSNYLQSATADAVFQQAGHVGLHAEQATAENRQAEVSQRVADKLAGSNSDADRQTMQLELVKLVQSSDRLTVTFRYPFEGQGAKDRDLWRAGQFAALRDLMASGVADNRQITVAGFVAGTYPSASAARNASVAAAETVRRDIATVAGDLMAQRGISVRAVGYGDASPIACEDHPHGVFVNDRVELFLALN